ncbi:MAG: AraC family transcriptional regulator [Bacteroidota bacterium]
MKPLFENIASSNESSFKCYHYENEEFSTPWHYHPEYELNFVVESHGMRYVGDSIKPFSAGDFVLLGPSLPHCWKNTEDHKGKSRSVVIQWKEDFVGEGWLSRPEFGDVRHLLLQSQRGLHFPAAQAAPLGEMMAALVDADPFDKLVGLLTLLKRLSGLSGAESLSSPGFVADLRHETNDRIDKIYAYVSANFHRKIALTEIAELVAMNPESFCRFFKKRFNRSFITFLNEYKISRACKMLIETDWQVKQIGYQCGYESLPFFHRQFEKFTGKSPLVYKREYRQVEPKGIYAHATPLND